MFRECTSTRCVLGGFPNGKCFKILKAQCGCCTCLSHGIGRLDWDLRLVSHAEQQNFCFLLSVCFSLEKKERKKEKMLKYFERIMGCEQFPGMRLTENSGRLSKAFVFWDKSSGDTIFFSFLPILFWIFRCIYARKNYMFVLSHLGFFA